MCYLHTLHIIDCCDESPATSGLSLPPSLQHFKASDAFEPSLLAAATKLTHLDLSCEWVPDEGDADFGAEWLRVLSKLQHLDYLQLILRYSTWPPASPAYQTLIASSSTLRVLLVDSRVPGEAFAHIFPSAPSHVLLPRLEVLAAFGIPQDSLGNVVSCCPALQQLTLNGEPLGSAHLTVLSQLSALTRLELSLEPRIADASTAVLMQSLAGLNRLQDLTLGLDTSGLPAPVEWSDALLQTLLPLTALQGLTRLLCTAGDRTVHLSMQAGRHRPPDVWLQLLELCAADSTCQRSIIRGHAQPLVQQQQDVQDLRQQLALVQRQLAQQEQHSAQLLQLLTGLQQQLASQQHGC